MKERCKQSDSGMWYARAAWTDPATGERRWKHVSAPSQTKCATKLIDVIADGRAGRAKRQSAMTVADLLALWLAAKRGRVKTSTYTCYESYARMHLAPRLGSIKLARLTPAIVQRTYGLMADDGHSTALVASAHRILYNALSMAEKQGHIQRNPAALVEPPRHRYPEAAVWSAADATRFLAHAEGDPMFGRVMALAIYTGMRQGELLAVRWADVDLAGATLRVRSASYRGVITEPKTQAGRRAIALSPDCLAMLSRHHAERAAVGATRPADLLFSRPDGQVLSFVTLRNRFVRLCQREELPPIRFHGLRHTHATLMLQAGVHPKVVQERLGHSSIAMTLDRYSHHVKGMQIPAALALDEALRAESVQNEDADHEKSL